jgi:hypothetical protein
MIWIHNMSIINAEEVISKSILGHESGLFHACYLSTPLSYYRCVQFSLCNHKITSFSLFC